MNSVPIPTDFYKRALSSGDVMNCTDHAINIVDTVGRCYTFHPTGYIIRVTTLRKTRKANVSDWIDIEVATINPIGLHGVPDDDGKSIYLVSKSSLDYAGMTNHPLKNRLFAPDTTMGEVRDRGNRVIAVTRLLTYNEED